MNTPTIPAPYANDEKLTHAYLRGYQHGNGFACNNVPTLGDTISRSVDYVGLGRVVTEENIREYHELCCFAAESNSRDFSPFEFTAHEFNSDEENSEALWEAFEAGTADSIRADLSTYSDSDYGIESWGEPPTGFVDYLLPDSWASYLVNGDASGLDDAEQAACDAWFDSHAEKLLGCCDCSETSEFRSHNDAGTIAGNCLYFRFPIKGFRFPGAK